MRSLMVASALAVFLCGSATAADIPTKAPPPLVPAASWTGLYAGVNAGVAWGNLHAANGLPGPTDTGGSGTFGGQIGYNWQASRNFVLGVEADLAWIDIHGRSAAAHFDEKWMGTVRARAGYAFDVYLLYATAGVGFTRVNTGVTPFGSNSATRAGFAGGFGIERWFAPNWTGKVEALFIDVPNRTYNNGGFLTGGGSDNYTVRAGINYHF